MASATAASDGIGVTPQDAALVDPRAPRFGQALTALGLATGVVLQVPAFVYAIAIVLNAAVLSGWRVDLYAFLWQWGARKVVDDPAEKERAAPHRFARVMGAAFTAIASLLLLAGTVGPVGAGIALVGYACAGAVAGLAGLAAAFDYCLGCKMYREVALFRDLGVV